MNRREHDRRPSIEHERDTEERFDRSLFVPGLYDKPGKPARLRVFWSEDATNGLVNVIDENTTSESRTAEGLLPPNEVLLLTAEQTRWLHRTLGELLPRLEAADAAALRALARPCTTCGGTRKVMKRPLYERQAREMPCPDCRPKPQWAIWCDPPAGAVRRGPEDDPGWLGADEQDHDPITFDTREDAEAEIDRDPVEDDERHGAPWTYRARQGVACEGCKRFVPVEEAKDGKCAGCAGATS